MRRVAWAMVALFVFAAAVQWNDPDPLRWIFLYGLAAATAYGVARGKSWTGLEWTSLAVFGAVVLMLSPAVFDSRSEAFISFEMKSAADESVREFAGMALCLAWVAAVVAWRRWSRAASA
jgi:signal transduction histidine kinase